MNSTKIFQAVLAYAQIDFVHLPYQDRIYGIIEQVAGQGRPCREISLMPTP